MQGVYAANLKNLRERMGLTQDGLATRLRRLGFDRWTRSLVASQENGRRMLRVEDAIAYCFALAVPLDEVLGVCGDTWVPLGDRVSIRGEALRHVLRGGHPKAMSLGELTRSRRWRFASPEQEHLHDELLRVLAPDADLDADGRGELEMDIAKRLAQSTPELNGKDGRLAAAAGHRLWGHSPSTERDLRAETRPRAKQHISREIHKEIAGLVGEAVRDRRGPT